MNKTLSLSALSLVMSALPVFAGDDADANSLSLSASVGYESQYVSRSLQTGEAILTPAATLSAGSWYAGFWAAVPVEHREAWPKELDLFAGRNFSLCESLSLDLGLMHYSYDKVFADLLGHDSSNELYAGLSLDAILSPTLYFYHDFDCLTDLAEFGLSHSVELGAGFALELAATLGASFGENEENPDYGYWGASADLSYALTENCALALGVRYAASTRDFYAANAGDDPDKKQALWWGTGFSAEF